MKYIYISMILFIITQTNFCYLNAMEHIRNYSDAQLTTMYESIKQSARIGDLGTLILYELIKEGYHETTMVKIGAHEFIKTLEITTPKSYSFQRIYNPFIIKGSCKNNNTPLAQAFLLTLQKTFIMDTEHETNDLNDHFFETDDKLQGFTQVDYCTSAKYANEKLDNFVYIARFFNKETLEHTMNVLIPQYIALQGEIKKT